MRKLFLATAIAGSFAMLAGAAAAQDDKKGDDRRPSRFERMDKNDDGKVSTKEAEKNAMRRFNRVDANGDGTLDDSDINASIEEAKKAMKQKDGELSDKQINRMERQKKLLEAQFKRMDANGDGELNFDEYKKGELSNHKRLDLNDDGYVTKKEIKKRREQRRKRVEKQRQKQSQDGQQ